jgi:phosphate transport system substrate-binding protein
MCLQARDTIAPGRRFQMLLAMFAVLRGYCRTYRHFLAVIPGAIVFLAANLSPVSADALVVQGSTTFAANLMALHQAAIEAKAGHKVIVIPNKSSTGLIALIEGRADFAMISTKIENEIALLRITNPNIPFERLRSFEVYRTRMAFAVHPTNPVHSVSPQTMRRVLLGEIKNWQELGGADLPIRVVMVRDGGGVQLSVETQLLGGAHIRPDNPIRVQISSQVVKVVEQEPGALGLAQLGKLREHRLPELTINIPIEQQLNLVTLGEPTPVMRAVIDAARSVAIENLN